MEATFLVGGVELNAKMHDGKLSAAAAAGPIAAGVHSTIGASYNAPSIPHLVAEKGKWWTDGICSEGLKFYHCRWESPEISYSYHTTLNVRSRTAVATLSNSHVYLQEIGNVRVCNIGEVAIGGIVTAGGYTPGPETNYPDLDNIVNGVIQLTLEPFQTIATTSLGNVAGWLMTSVECRRKVEAAVQALPGGSPTKPALLRTRQALSTDASPQGLAAALGDSSIIVLREKDRPQDGAPQDGATRPPIPTDFAVVSGEPSN